MGVFRLVTQVDIVLSFLAYITKTERYYYCYLLLLLRTAILFIFLRVLH